MKLIYPIICFIPYKWSNYRGGFVLFFSLIFFSFTSWSQDCEPRFILPNTSYIDPTVNPENHYFVFDNMTKFNGGILLSGATKLHVKVKEIGAANSCKWKLEMRISNAGSADPLTAADEWALQSRYSYPTAATNYPKISELEVKVYNECGTPYLNGIFRNFTNTGDALDIIQDVAYLQPSAILPCPTSVGQVAPDNHQVNAAGDYLQYYSQFTFMVDYKIKIDIGSSGYTSGIYNLVINFRLIEVP